MKYLAFLLVLGCITVACRDASTAPEAPGTQPHLNAHRRKPPVTERTRVLLASTNFGELIRIDLDAGTATLIGDAGTIGDREPGWTGLSFDRLGRLYVTSRAPGEPAADGCIGLFAGGPCTHLYLLDPLTGQIIDEIGSTGGAFISDIDFGRHNEIFATKFLDDLGEGDGGQS